MFDLDWMIIFYIILVSKPNFDFIFAVQFNAISIKKKTIIKSEYYTTVQNELIILIYYIIVSISVCIYRRRVIITSYVSTNPCVYRVSNLKVKS